MSIVTLKDYIAEARKEDAEYKEEKTKGLVNKVILELEGSDAGTATKLAKRFHRLKKSISRLQEAEKALEPKLRGLVDNAFDEAKDIFVTRTLATAQFTITIAKKQDAKDKSEVSYDKVFERLAALLDDDLQVKLKELIEANTRRWVAEPPKASMTVKPIEESVVNAAKGALGSMITKLEAFIAKLKARFTAWAKQYDAKLDNLKDMVKKLEAEPIVAEAAPGKFAAFVAEADELSSLRKKLKWHVSRAGSGGSHSDADQLAKRIDAIENELDIKAKGADEVEFKGKKYRRTGPKSPADKAGQWKLCESTQLTTAEKAEIIKDFVEWSGGFTPDECPHKPDGRGDDELNHKTYLENALLAKFAGKKGAVEAFLRDYEPLIEASNSQWCVIIVMSSGGRKSFNTAGVFDSKDEAQKFCDKANDKIRSSSVTSRYEVKFMVPTTGTSSY